MDKWLNRMNGISDEAGDELAIQLAAHQRLGWKKIELRTINGLGIERFSLNEIEQFSKQITNAGLCVPIVDSSLGNWNSSINDDTELVKNQLKKYIHRMKILGAKYLRVMSYPCPQKKREKEWGNKVIHRLREWVDVAEDENITLLHENCIGWGGISAHNSLALVNTLQSEHLELLFDIGNGIAYGYDSLEFLKLVYPWVKHVHVKDAKIFREKIVYCEPGKGQSKTVECLKFLLKNNYKGDFSIEPHIIKQIHNHSSLSNEKHELFNSYIDYAQSWLKLFTSIIKQHANGTENVN